MKGILYARLKSVPEGWHTCIHIPALEASAYVDHHKNVIILEGKPCTNEARYQEIREIDVPRHIVKAMDISLCADRELNECAAELSKLLKKSRLKSRCGLP